MDLSQMLKNIADGKINFLKEDTKCPKCKDTGRDKKFICSCTAGDREAKKRAEKNGKVQGECEVKLVGFKS